MLCKGKAANCRRIAAERERKGEWDARGGAGGYQSLLLSELSVTSLRQAHLNCAIGEIYDRTVYIQSVLSK
jgi:hypothetical protein